MQLDGFGADAQSRGDRMVGAALQNPLQHVFLTRCEANQAGWRFVVRRRPLDLAGRQQFRWEVQAAFNQRLQRIHEALDFGQLGDEARGAVVDALQRDLHIALTRDDADALGRRCGAHGLQRGHAAAVGQTQIQQHDIDRVLCFGLCQLAQSALQRIGLREARGRIQVAVLLLK